MVTIKNIADSLNISTSTVSKALNDATDISAELRQAVLEKAVEMGYTTKSSRKKINRKLAVLIKNMAYGTQKDFGYNILLGFRQAAMNRDWNVEVMDVTRDLMVNEKYDTYLLKHGFSGAFCLGFTLRDPWTTQFQTSQMPTVLLDNFVSENPHVACIGTENTESMEYAIQHLVMLHHRRIAFFCGEAHSRVSQDRLDAFERAMEAQGLKVYNEMILFGDYLTPEVRNHLAPAFEKKATAIVCANDIIAANVIDECVRCGRRVPEDVSVIGFDDIPLASITEPPLTTIRQNRKNIGMLAMTVLSELCDHVPIALVQIRPQLIIRGSTAKAPEL